MFDPVMFVSNREDIHNYYPNKFIQRDDTERFYILNTLFNLSGIKCHCRNIDFDLVTFVYLSTFKTNQKRKFMLYMISATLNCNRPVFAYTLQRLTSTPALWTTSQDAPGTQSEWNCLTVPLSQF